MTGTQGPGGRAVTAAVVTIAMSLASPVTPTRLLAARTQPSLPTRLRIVVMAGEDAVNVIQQKTAVAPIVEVRDENDLPVAGVLLRFSVRGGRGASFGGQPALTVTTDAAGRAAATNYASTAPGRVQIDVDATYRGLTATAVIAQMTYATAAQAAKAGQGGAIAGAAATGGGGLSGMTIGLIAGGIAVGAAGVAVALRDDDTPTPPPPPTSTNLNLTGDFRIDAPLTWTFTFTTGSCRMPRTLAGSLRIVVQVQPPPSNTVTGTMNATLTQTTGNQVCSGSIGPPVDLVVPSAITAAVTGTASSVSAEQTVTVGQPNGIRTFALRFNGAIANSQATGTIGNIETWNLPSQVASLTSNGTTSITLR